MESEILNDVAIFTIVSANYLAYARSLMGSVADCHPEADRHLVLVDELDGTWNPAGENFTVTEARSLGITDFSRMAFRYDILEFNTAVKPFAFRHLFAKGYQKVIYFDPDILLYHDLHELVHLLDKHAIVLTPHMTVPLPFQDACEPSEQSCLASGTYNLGFVALSNSADGLSLCEWWCEKCRSLCYSEIENGLFVDQKWMNQVPGFWHSVHILRNPGYNVAYWNLHERRVEGTSINGKVPLIFFHFSGITLHNLDLISKYQNRFTLTERGDISALYHSYRDLLLSNGHDELKGKPYCYGFFEDGSAIGHVARRLYPAVADLYPHPFVSGAQSYQALLRKRGLLEKSSAHMDFLHNVIADEGRKERYQNWINLGLKVFCRIAGIRLYLLIMCYLIENGSIRKQDFLLGRQRVEQKDNLNKSDEN